MCSPGEEVHGICFEFVLLPHTFIKTVLTRDLFYKHLKLLIMKNLLIVFLFFMITTLSSCSVIGDIFKAGVWVGVLAVVIIVGLIIYFISRASAKK